MLRGLTSLLPFALLALLVVLAACHGSRPAPPSESAPAIGRPLLPALRDADPAVRRDAATQLGLLRSASRQVVDALLAAQWDDDESVAAAAVAALNRIRPGPEVAILVPRGTSFESVVEVLVRPAFTTWQEVDCELASGMEGERLVACWRLVDVPPIYQTRIKQAQPFRFVWRNAKEVEAEEAVRAEEIAAVRAAPPPPEVPPMNRILPPAGEPAGAQPGEVWCRHEHEHESEPESETEAGATWRRHPECEEADVTR